MASETRHFPPLIIPISFFDFMVSDHVLIIPSFSFISALDRHLHSKPVGCIALGYVGSGI